MEGHRPKRRKTNLPLQTAGRAAEETEWAGVTEGGDWAGETRSYGVVKGEPGEEHSGKKRQARNVGDDPRGLRAGLS